VSVVVPLAHAGHWVEGAIYFAPVALVVGALAFQSLRDRRAQHRDADADERDDQDLS
jgi:hypothetical protein